MRETTRPLKDFYESKLGKPISDSSWYRVCDCLRGTCGEITRENLEMYAIKFSCLGCIYVSGDKLLPCAIHPKEQSEDCPDKTFI
ncbi:MAG: hypothetical protein AAF630_12405 [Cyanobacteria bacterium P01_C01_bin.38]